MSFSDIEKVSKKVSINVERKKGKEWKEM